MMSFRLIRAWYEIAISAQRLKAQDLFKNIGRDRHPPFAAFRKKVLLGAINNANAAVVDPMSAGVHDFNVAEPQTRKK